MSIIEIILLAVVQAFTEFIPVSSSGHLLAIQKVFSIESTLAIDVMLHFGTLVALVVYFKDQLVAILQKLRAGTVSQLTKNIIISTIPAALAGFFLNDIIETSLRNIPVVITMLVVVGILMILSDRLKVSKSMTKEKLYPQQAALIGLGQALALIPGTSRSGVTMLSAKAIGLSNKQAADYSFLIGIPIILGATIKVVASSETIEHISNNTAQVAIGIIISAVVGFWVLRYLLQFVSKHGLAVFGWYRLGLALILFILEVTA